MFCLRSRHEQDTPGTCRAFSEVNKLVTSSEDGPSYLAVWRIGYPPHCGYHREGAGRLIGALLPGDRIIWVRGVTVGREKHTDTGVINASECFLYKTPLIHFSLIRLALSTLYSIYVFCAAMISAYGVKCECERERETIFLRLQTCHSHMLWRYSAQCFHGDSTVT